MRRLVVSAENANRCHGVLVQVVVGAGLGKGHINVWAKMGTSDKSDRV